MTNKAEVGALCERLLALAEKQKDARGDMMYRGDADPEIVEATDALKALVEENERLTLQRDEAREQFDNHVAWASDQLVAAERKAEAMLTAGREIADKLWILRCNSKDRMDRIAAEKAVTQWEAALSAHKGEG